MKGYYNINDVKVQNDKNVIYDYTNETKEVASDIDFEGNLKEDMINDAHKMHNRLRIHHNDEISRGQNEGNTSKVAVIAVMGLIATVLVASVVIVITSSMSSAKENKDINTVSANVTNENNEKENVVNNNGEDVSNIEEQTDQSDVEVVNNTSEDNKKTNNNANGTEQNVSTTEDTVRKKVQALCATDNRVTAIYRNFDKYPLNLMKDIVRNQEMIDFTVGYLDGIQKTYDSNIDISASVNDTKYKIPLLIQWDSRWGYYKYGNSTVGISGCGPTALNMVYLALTGDQSYNPLKMAQFSTDNGYCVPGVGTSWSLMIEGANQLGLQSQRMSNNEMLMRQNLEQGKLIIGSMGPGTFTDKGHFIVFSGYENGQFRINDPFCIANSARAWSYSEFGNQIKALWVFSR